MSFVVFRASFLLRRSKDVHKLTNVFRGTVLLRSYNISWKYLLEYNVYNESWEQFSLFLIEGSSARKKEREIAMP